MRWLLDLRVILSIILVLVIITGAAVGFLYYNNFNNKLQEKDLRIAELEYGLQQIGQLVPAFTVNSDVRMGKEIKETDLTPIEVPISMATNIIGTLEELKGKHYKVDLKAGTPITTDVVTEIEITDDVRLLDVVLHTVPVGIEPGDYVDIRIALPMGEDFIGMSHKRVYDVNGGVLKIAVNEEDIHAYNSMLVDSLLYPGTMIYALEYLEGGAQKAADTYYPISKSVLAIAEKDPNLISAIKADMLLRREAVETSLDSIKISASEIERTLQRGRERLASSIDAASKEYERRMSRLADEERRAERNRQVGE